ncbi:MAG TPA: hypothetical protein ENJ93_05890 [Chloroflexi bacterium]|nr:hypothetical protein [Chloroflexota bacterium]
MRRLTILLLGAVAGVMWVTAVSQSPPAAADFARQTTPPDTIPVDAAAFAAAFPQGNSTPASDLCSDAPDVVFLGNAFGGTTNVTDMTESADDPVLNGMWGVPPSNKGYRTVWYSLQTAFNGVVTIDAQTSNYDTVVGVFTGTCGFLTAVTSNDDYTGFTSRITFTIKKNVTYYVEAADWSPGAAGQKNLNLFIQAEPIDSQWQQLPVTAWSGLTAMASAPVGSQIYTVGGEGFGSKSNKVYQYDPPSNTWTERATIPLPPSVGLSHAAAVYLNNSIYTAGGDEGAASAFSNRHQVYNVSTAGWTTLQNVPAGVGWSAAVAVPGQNQYYLLGGASTKPTLTTTTAVHNQVWLYNIAGNSWSQPSAMLTPRYGHTAAYVGGQICVVGGLDDNNVLLSNGECWTPGGGSWQTSASLNVPRYGAGSAVAPDGRWFIFGGQGADHKAVSEVEVYDPANPGAGWVMLNVPFDLGGGLNIRARAWPTGQFIGRTLYALGGNDTIEGNVIPYVQSLQPPGRLTSYLPVVMNGAGDFDDNFSVARPLSFNAPHNGDFAQPTDFFDAYTFNVNVFTPVTIRLSQIPASSEYRLTLFNNNKSVLGESSQPGNLDKVIQTALGPGRYYLMVERIYGSSGSSHYQLVVNN